MLSAEGLGLFYVRKEVMDKMSVLQYGWHMVENLGDYNAQDFTLADSAKRFECGSANMLGIYALNASVKLLLDTGMQNIGTRVINNSQFMVEQLKSINGIELLIDDSEQRLSGIVTFRCNKLGNDDLYRYLSDREILCASRGGGIRFSPHFYTPREQLEQAVCLIREI